MKKDNSNNILQENKNIVNVGNKEKITPNNSNSNKHIYVKSMT